MAIEPEPVHSIDEQVSPAKTKRSGICHFNPKKWGFKMFVHAGQSGMMYGFFLYAGIGSANNTDCSAANIVLLLSEGKSFKLFFDNWFCTLPLYIELKSLGILLNRRYSNPLSIPKRNQMALLKFSCKIADGLLYKCKPVDRPVGRSPKRKSLQDVIEGKE